MHEEYHPPKLDKQGIFLDEWPTCLGLISHASKIIINKRESKRKIDWRDGHSGLLLTQFQTAQELDKNHAGTLQLRTIGRDATKGHLDLALYTAQEGVLIKVNKATMNYKNDVDRSIALRECLAMLVSQPLVPTSIDASEFNRLVVIGAAAALGNK